MKFSTPEASSARSDRHFSGGKLALETKRNCLGDYSLILTKTSYSTKDCLTKKKYRY